MSVVFVALAVALIRRSADGPPPQRYLQATVAVLLAGVTLTALVAMPRAAEFWAQLHGTSPDNIVVSEDGSGVALIKLNQPDSGGKQIVFVNGLGQSALPYGEIHTVLGAIPAFLHPHPTSAMVIGLGSGDTVHAVAGRPDIDRITSIEIVRSQLPTLEALRHRVSYGGLQSLLTNPRIEHVVGDGRIHLMRGTEGYDIIEADALRPGSAYAGNLYSDEFFRLVRARLRPGGLAATWVPTERVRNTFLRAFPYVVSLPQMMVGSNTAIELDRGSIAERLVQSDVERYYRSAGIDIARLFEEFLAAPVIYTPDFDRSGLTDFNTDLFPKDEYDLSSPPRADGAIR
jgi:spermidine synthase